MLEVPVRWAMQAVRALLLVCYYYYYYCFYAGYYVLCGTALMQSVLGVLTLAIRGVESAWKHCRASGRPIAGQKERLESMSIKELRQVAADTEAMCGKSGDGSCHHVEQAAREAWKPRGTAA